jgi:hypothetical protein
VAEHLGGSAASSLALRSKWEVSRAWQNGDGTAHRLVLIGERRAASTLRHRLLLFKMLAPLVRRQQTTLPGTRQRQDWVLKRPQGGRAKAGRRCQEEGS